MAHLFPFFKAEGVGPPSPEFFVLVSSDRISKISVYDGCKLCYFFVSVGANGLRGVAVKHQADKAPNHGKLADSGLGFLLHTCGSGFGLQQLSDVALAASVHASCT